MFHNLFGVVLKTKSKFRKCKMWKGFDAYMYLADFDNDENDVSILYIGWLDKKYPYPKGSVPTLFISKLWEFCCFPIDATFGFHTCEFCENPTFGIRVKRNSKECRLGSAEIRVFGQNGIVYAAPDLIYHYVVEHNYQPPNAFIDAVLEGILPFTEQYKALSKNYDWVGEELWNAMKMIEDTDT